MAIKFYSEDTNFAYRKVRRTAAWLTMVIAQGYHRSVGVVSVVFCSNNYLLNINREYLNHDYFTDVITFDYSEGTKISGDIFVSTDMVGSNAVEYGVSFEDELLRVILHGILHLCGENDKYKQQQAAMRQAEDKWLQAWQMSNLQIATKKKF